ncbi:T9SS type A sorting domain-containing protein [Hymenobacter sp. BT188]|uniref:T9SS type A sorting domain-containing protein n=1 Tax=Hymenobacter sp. BT188 TaxID=2763504 RepID=UPI0016515CBC|nr:T9SS type A sorting domain-containing protein [Hymenobacter sp. BT188]MBC6605334.1 T9SS type A sorting domain-containing protein [Hymenobacter sp. BT188]
MRFFTVGLRLPHALFTIGTLLICFLLAPTSYAAPYTWVGTGGNNNWSNANNWDPARIPATDDVLIFDGSRTATANVYVDFASPQIISQLRFINNITAVLTVQPNSDITAAPPARQLSMATALTGANFEIDAGSSVQVKSPDGVKSTAGMGFYLGTEGTATIAGTLIFGSSSTASLTNDPHQLISQKKGFNTIHFVAGSTFRADKTFTGFPFNDKSESGGTTVFRSGSIYDHRGGGAPFGTSLPTAPVTILEKGNRYIYSVTSTAAGPQLPGRTYGYMEYNRPTTATGIVGGSATVSSTGLPLVILDDLIITTGNVRLNLANIAIQGNLIINGGTLANTAGASTITFNGASNQLITSAAAIPVPVSFGSFITVVIDNATGVTLQTPVQISKALTLTNGVVNTSAGTLTLLTGATVVGHDKSFVSGPLTRVVAASGNTSLTFPLGFGTAFRPLTMSLNHSDGAEVRYTAEQIKGKPTARLFTGEVNKVSAVRYFNVSSNATTSNLLSSSIQLSYGADDQVDNAEKLRIVKSSPDNQSWENIGGMGSAIPTGSITSTIPFTSLGTFVLASTEVSSTSGSNPLPVELISFSAERRAQGVLLRWATASEKNNASFDVERSADGRLFETVGKVKGQGQSTQKQAYSLLDTAPFSSSTAYYRLRQLDFDGAATYSNVVVVKGQSKEELFPNPARNQLTFHLPYNGTADYRILSSTGQALQKGQSASTLTTLDISGLPAGFYYLEIAAAEGRIVRKFIKQAD